MFFAHSKSCNPFTYIHGEGRGETEEGRTSEETERKKKKKKGKRGDGEVTLTRMTLQHCPPCAARWVLD